MMAKSPLGPPNCWHTTSSCPHMRLTIAGVSVSMPSMRREKTCPNVCQGVLVCGLIEEINSGKAGEGNKIVKKHIEK